MSVEALKKYCVMRASTRDCIEALRMRERFKFCSVHME